MPPPFETDRAARVRRNPWIMALAASPLGLALAAIVGAIGFGAPQPLVILPHMIILGLVFSAFAWKKNSRPREVPGKLVADDRGVSFAGELLVPRGEIKSGLVLPRAGGAPVVRFRRRGLHVPVDLRVADRDEGRALLRALGLDATQSVATFTLPSMAFGDPKQRWRFAAIIGVVAALLVPAAAILSHLSPAAAMIFPVGLILILLTATVLTAIPTKLRVGADGLHATWLRYSRFIGYGDVARIDPYEDEGSGKNKLAGLRLTMKSGEVVPIPVLAKRSSVRDEIYILHERIAQAIETWSRGEGVAHAALVRRGGRETSQWVRALRGIGAFANADARTAPVMPEKLWRIVEDPAAPADARAGAAVALGQSADEEARVRLRAAAAATAAPKLRIAIEAAAREEPDEALEAALAEVESEESARQRKA